MTPGVKGGDMEVDGEVRLAGPDEIQREMEIFFEHLGRWKRPVFLFEKAWKPRCDVSETGDEVVVVADLAGVEPDNVGIEVHGDILVMRGVRREPAGKSRGHYHIMEINYGTFEREIRLPAAVKAEKARAVYEEGFLEVRLPKAAKEPPKGVEIDVAE